MEIGGTAFMPEIHLSVMVQGAQLESLAVLMQGYVITTSNAARLLQLLRERIQLIEDDWAARAQQTQDSSQGASQNRINSSRASLSGILQNAVFALNSLPTDGAPILALVTDGVVDMFDAYSYDNLVMQLIRHDVQCHFLRVGGNTHDPNSSFGFVPDIDLLQFIADSSGGSVLDTLSLREACYGAPQTDRLKRMTRLQQDCLLRPSSVHAISAPIVKLNEMWCTPGGENNFLPLRPYRMWREKVHEYRIFAEVDRIVEARIREGFVINKVHIKTSKNPLDGGNQRRTDGSVDFATDPIEREVTKVLIVFLLQWKQNVWLEYVVSTTTDGKPEVSTFNRNRRPSIQDMKPMLDTKKASPTSIMGAWTEWYVKMNILADAEFLRAFEDSIQQTSSAVVTNKRGAATRKNDTASGSPSFLHAFIRNVQDVDRVLLHLMTAMMTANSANESRQQFSFGNSGSASSVALANSTLSQHSHPVFNIIGELSSVLWHRWFYVERFEVLCVVKNEGFMDAFYKSEPRGVMKRGYSARSVRAASPSRNYLHAQGAISSMVPVIGVDKTTEAFIELLTKWSTQKLSKDLFLKFLSSEKNAPKKSATPVAGSSANIAGRRRQRPVGVQTNATNQEDASLSSPRSTTSLCFVRLEIKNKTLFAVHVAFFSTGSPTRKQTLADLKSTISSGLNDALPYVPSPAPASKSVVLCQRLISRLLVNHESLLLHDDHGDDASGHSKGRPQESSAAYQNVSSCCGGSEMQLRSVFGSYMWHCSWQWHIANPNALASVMRRLHEARVSSGFWVLDWKLEDSEDKQQFQVQSVIYGREIMMEDEQGYMKTSLVQYGLRQVSETCLMTSIWMEPQHGIVKSRFSDEVKPTDKFHWGLKHAVGHNVPFEETATTHLHVRASTVLKSNSLEERQEEERQSMELEDIPIDWSESMFLGENELLDLIRGYVFSSDRHIMSCLYTFDCVMNLRESIELYSQMSKGVEGVVGSTWRSDQPAEAPSNMLLPPFSTARLLGTSTRSTEHFLMYLENGHRALDEDQVDEGNSMHTVSPANAHLFSMLERTLRSLSDCEVSWTDFNGDEVLETSKSTNGGGNQQLLAGDGWSGQLPIWLKHRMLSSVQDTFPAQGLSRGKCFAKLLDDNSVVLAFLPALDTVQVRRKVNETAGRKAARSMDESSVPLPDRLKWLQEGRILPARQGASPGRNTTELSRMSASADDIVLYQERRMSFREGYKSWRMGHFQGSKDAKQTYGQNFQKLRLPSTPEDHEFCEHVTQQAGYGSDFHLIIEQDSDGALGSGFFQVAFYECSLSRLSSDTNVSDNSGQARLSMTQTVLKQLFSSESTTTNPPTPMTKNARSQASVQSPAGTIPPSPLVLQSESFIASRRFRKTVKRAHEHNFSRGVYISLRDGGNVQQSDLMQALSSCIEVPVDVDITLLYRMLEVVSAKPGAPVSLIGDPRQVLKDRLDKSIETILASVFASITGTKYFYFTGSEHAIYDDLSDDEYDLHFLMEDADEAESVAPSDDQANQSLDDHEVSSQDSVSVEELSVELLQTASKPPLAKSISIDTSNAEHRRHRDSDRAVRKSARRRIAMHIHPSSAPSSSADVSLLDQHASVEEDAEFNKEVAVATSSFSSPFFFRFECREISNRRSPIGAEPKTSQTSAVNTEIVQHSSKIKPLSDVRRDLMSLNQSNIVNSVDTRVGQEAIEACLSSLAGDSARLESDITNLAGSIGKSTTCRIALRLVTLTLPREHLFDPSNQLHLNHQHMLFDMDDSGQPGALHPSMSTQFFAALPVFQKQVLKRIRREIKEWSSVEILGILQAAHKITPPIGHLVQKLFEDLPSHSVTKARYNLDFVGTSQDTPVIPLELFKKEIERNEFLHLHKCNGVYFVVEHKVKLEPAETDNGTVAYGSFEIPYWAFFVVEKDHITLFFHHPDRFLTSVQSFNRLSVLTRLHVGIQSICKRVNQYLLLLQLHETRACNGLLLPSESSQHGPVSPKRKDSSNGSFDSIEASSPRAFFWPGQFQCDLQYSAFFKLNERLSPNIILNSLCTSALEQFQVHNRRHTFVYRDRGGHVFYMKISVSSSNVPVVSSDALTERKRASTGSIISIGSPTSSTVGILLEVFGVCEAGEEVTHELCRVLERKLDEATQLVLMKLLARNAKFQLSSSDMAFICPPAGVPTQMTTYLLPTKVQEAVTILHFLDQTLSLSPYIRHASHTGSVSSRHSSERRASTNIRANNTAALAIIENNIQEASKENSDNEDPTKCHPALFGQKPMGRREETDKSVDVISPVFFHSKPTAKMTPSTPAEIIEQSAYVLNLNPELRLSSGFLSKVGKGLAVLRVEIVQSHGSTDGLTDQGSFVSLENCGKHDSTSAEDSTKKSPSNFFVRFQLWIRGTISAPVLNEVLEGNLKEALIDYNIEATLKEHRKHPSSHNIDETTQGLPSEVMTLISLFDSACTISSASVAKLVSPCAISPWDVENVVAQIQQILQCIPEHLRPVVYAKKKASDHFEVHSVGNRNRSMSKHEYHKFRLVARLDTDIIDSSNERTATTTSTSGPHLKHSDSIPSDVSELDKVSLTIGSESNGSALVQSYSSSSLGSSQQHNSKEFSESDMLLHQSVRSSPLSTTEPATQAHECRCLVTRSFYYVIDVSTSDGLRCYGYNMGSNFMDAILVQIARVLTWSNLREKLLRNLLLNRSGIIHSGRAGSAVIHPRDLYVNGVGNGFNRTSLALPSDFCVDYVEIWRPVMEILRDYATIPKALDSVHARAIEGSSLWKFLREAYILSSDHGDSHRPRARSSASVKSNAGPPDLNREVSSQSSQRSMLSENAYSTSVAGRGVPPSTKSDKTVPSPTKRLVGGNSNAPYMGNNNGGASGASGRMRATAGAATALMAARARARGGLPGRPGGPGVGRTTNSGESVAPWDMPLPTVKGPTLSASRNDVAPPTGGSTKSISSHAGGNVDGSLSLKLATIGRHRGSDNELGRRNGRQSSNVSLRDHSSPPHSPVNGLALGDISAQVLTSSNSSSALLASKRSWSMQLVLAWSPRATFTQDHCWNSQEEKPEKMIRTRSMRLKRGDKRKDPVEYFSNALQTRLQVYEARSTSNAVCLNLLEKLVTIKPREVMNDAVSHEIVGRIMQCGHSLLHQRYRVSFIERWEFVKVDEEYRDDDMEDGRLRALQASMDLVNLLSYKRDFVLRGKDRAIAKLYTELTVLGMCADDGEEIREMKKQIMHNIFHLKMEVVHAFYDQFAVHLGSLGFRHLRTLDQHALPRGSSVSMGSFSRVRDEAKPSTVGIIAHDDEAFTEYFYYATKLNETVDGWPSHASESNPPSLLLLELKCDHHGVRVVVSLVNESDLQQHDLAFQNRLVPMRMPTNHAHVSGNMVKTVSTWLKSTLETEALVYGFTVRFFHNYMTKWSKKPATDTAVSDTSKQTFTSTTEAHSYQNIVKGIRCFLNAFPTPPVTAGRLLDGCILQTAVVELPPTQLHSNCSESILLKILLRYIACHGARYDVVDLMQYGTPDTVVCHSTSGFFFHRQPSGLPKTATRPLPDNFAGYSLLITTQSLAVGFGLEVHEKRRRKNCVQLILVKSTPLTRGVANTVIPVGRALQEAEQFVLELFRVAAENYERDLLWSRLLYDDRTGPCAKVASMLALPVDHFRVEVGTQQLEECLRLSVCTPLEEIDPTLQELLGVEGVCWQEYALRLRDLYADQLREYRFDEEEAVHVLLLCPDTFDLIIHLTFPAQSAETLGASAMTFDAPDDGSQDSHSNNTNSSSSRGNGNGLDNSRSASRPILIEICRREEPPNRKFTFAQRRVITDFVNSIIHWQWRSLLYD